MASRRSGERSGAGDRGSNNEHRHTVPNATYTSFPCYQEEVNIKTNVTKVEESSGSGTEGGTSEDFQVNVSLQDKLRMCFQEMESLKGQFDQRRNRKLSAKKKAFPTPKPETEPLYSTPHRPSTSTSASTMSKSRPIPPKITKSNFEFTADSAAGSIAPSTSAKNDEENKFKARLIRTSSKDSVDLLEQLKGEEGFKMFDIYSDSPGYEEIRYPVAQRPLPVPVEEPIYTKVYRRPLGDQSGIPVPTRSASTSTSVRPESTGPRMALNRDSKLAKSTPDSLSVPKTADTRKSFDDWLEKLDEVNDISRSTLNRIKYLESEISNLKRATDKLQNKQTARITSKIPIAPISSAPPPPPSTPLLPLKKSSPTADAIVEKIFKKSEPEVKRSEPETVNRRNTITLNINDKETNTEIDYKLMEELIKNFKRPSSQTTTYSKPSTIVVQQEISNSNITNKSRAKRRLTTTINRSIEIQTEVFQSEKSVSTDDEKIPPQRIESVFKEPELEIHNIEDVPILDLPNIETPTPSNYPQSTSTPMPSSSRRSSKIAEPIIEIYSDSDETSFDDFEKNIYNQISKRALIKSQMSSRRHEEEDDDDQLLTYGQKDLDALRVKTSSTQTMEPEAEKEKPIYRELPLHRPAASDYSSAHYRTQSPKRQSKRHFYPETRPGTPEQEAEDPDSPFESAGFHEPAPQPPPAQEPTQPPHPPVQMPVLKRNLQSSSTIFIERVGSNRKEQSEIVLKTNVDNDGVVHRTTEVKNRKFRPRSSSRAAPVKPSQYSGAQKTSNQYSGAEKHLRKVNSDMNVRHSKNYIQRPVSAFDISGDGGEYSKSKHLSADLNMLGDKAFSTMDIPSKSPVISEGYHSEYLDSHPRIDSPAKSANHYALEPPYEYQAYPVLQELETNLDDDANVQPDDWRQTETPIGGQYGHSPIGRQWEEISKSQVLNTMTNEALNRYGDVALGKSSLMTFTNEMVIDTVGKETNITTKSRTIRKYAPLNPGDAPLPSRSKSTFDLSNQDAPPPSNLDRHESQSQYDLYDRQLQPYDNRMQLAESHDQNAGLIPIDEQQPMACNFSLVYNCGNNVVIRANFGMAKLPIFETNL